jgi:23S rRNA pseudouridine2605 synthase
LARSGTGLPHGSHPISGIDTTVARVFHRNAMRLNKFLSSAGLGSRRGCEVLIREGRVTVNGKVITDLATQVEEGDAVKADGRLVKAEASMTLLLNKPPGYLCTHSDTHDRKTIYDLIPANFPRLAHVGRLDKESEGLILLTNDGDLSLRLTHPRHKIEKEYEVKLDHPFEFDLAPKLRKGISIEGGMARMEKIVRISRLRVRVVLKQGIKRQIRLMFHKIGYEVEELRRVRIGTIVISDLRPGEWRRLNSKEIEMLRRG